MSKLIFDSQGEVTGMDFSPDKKHPIQPADVEAVMCFRKFMNENQILRAVNAKRIQDGQEAIDDVEKTRDQICSILLSSTMREEKRFEAEMVGEITPAERHWSEDETWPTDEELEIHHANDTEITEVTQIPVRLGDLPMKNEVVWRLASRNVNVRRKSRGRVPNASLVPEPNTT